MGFIYKVLKKVLSRFNYDEKDLSVFYESQYKKDKYIFLDIDGVLIKFKNTKSVEHSEFKHDDDWDKEAIKYINTLVEKTKAKVVIISSYRITKTRKELQDKFNEVGLKINIHDITPVLKEQNRGDEIKKYINDNNIKNFIIIDDQLHNSENLFPSEFVKVTTHIGFNKNNFEKSIKLLNKNLNENTSKPTVVYSAVVIENPTEISKLNDIVEKYVPINHGWRKPHDFHMTISMGKFPESLYLRGDLNKEVTLKIEYIGVSNNAIALSTSGYYSKNDIPHITLAFQNNSEPAASKEIQDWKPIDNLSITGTIREIGEGNIVIK